jgi:hypothetical protein
MVFVRRGRHLADGDSGLERHEPSSQVHEKLRKRIPCTQQKTRRGISRDLLTEYNLINRSQAINRIIIGQNGRSVPCAE